MKCMENEMHQSEDNRFYPNDFRISRQGAMK